VITGKPFKTVSVEPQIPEEDRRKEKELSAKERQTAEARARCVTVARREAAAVASKIKADAAARNADHLLATGNHRMDPVSRIGRTASPFGAIALWFRRCSGKGQSSRRRIQIYCRRVTQHLQASRDTDGGCGQRNLQLFGLAAVHATEAGMTGSAKLRSAGNRSTSQSPIL